jgi:hypothetical protein
MIQPIPGKKRYQVLMDRARPGHFEFVADFDKDSEAETHAKETHAGYEYADVVVFDAKQGTLRLTLPGSRTLSGTSVP